MRTVKWNPFLWSVGAFLGGALLWAGTARADVSSTNPAAIVVFPKLVVDGDGTDTIIQLTNTAAHPVNVRCFYINASGHCSDSSSTFCDPGQPASQFCSPSVACVPSWQETDFAFRLTSKQPISWVVGLGLADLPLEGPPGTSGMGDENSGSIPPSPENPMLGELKCVEVGSDELPGSGICSGGTRNGQECSTNADCDSSVCVPANDLKGEATIESMDTSPSIDSEGYNGIGIQAIANGNNHDNTLMLDNKEYNACPSSLILDHFFDDATEPSDVGDTVRTFLTLVPCTEDLNLQIPATTTVQYLVFNEFEQRFSTSRPVTCFSELGLSDIDTRLGDFKDNDLSSIFNVNLEGTITGQTIIRGVTYGLLAVAEEFHLGDGTEYSAAYLPVQHGSRTTPDIIQLPAASPAN